MIPIPIGLLASTGGGADTATAYALLSSLGVWRHYRSLDCAVDGNNSPTAWLDRVNSIAVNFPAATRGVKQADNSILFRGGISDRINMAHHASNNVTLAMVCTMVDSADTSVGQVFGGNDSIRFTHDGVNPGGSFQFKRSSYANIPIQHGEKRLIDFVLPSSGNSSVRQYPDANNSIDVGNVGLPNTYLLMGGLLGGFNRNPRNFLLYEFLVFPSVLTDPQRATLYAAMQALHPGI